MKPLYIIGAGGAAKEIYLLVKEINDLNQVYDFRGFIDVNDNNQFLRIGSSELPIFEEAGFLSNQKEKVAVIFGLGEANKLKQIVKLYLQKPNLEFPNIIHPDVLLNESIYLGKGNIINTKCVLTADISIESFNYINRGTHIGHDCKISSYNVINPCTVISGGVEIGDENLIGTNATLLQYLKIGSKNKIGAGAVLTKNLSSMKVAVGVPAKIIKEL